MYSRIHEVSELFGCKNLFRHCQYIPINFLKIFHSIRSGPGKFFIKIFC